MFGNCIMTGFCLLLARLLQQYKLRTTTDTRTLRQTAKIMGVIIVFLLFNSLLVTSKLIQLQRMAAAEPVRYQSVLDETASGTPVLITGIISRDNPAVKGSYIAYQDETALWSPKDLRVDLDRGHIDLNNDSYHAMNWPVDAGNNAYLEPGQTVVVSGYIQRAKVFAGPDKGMESMSIRAADVFAGNREEYLSAKKSEKYMAISILLVNIIGVAWILLLTVNAWKIPRQTSPF